MEQTENRVNITHNGQETSALNLLPNLDSQEIAVVDFGVLKRLSDLLPKAHISKIISNFRDNLSYIENMEGFVALLQDELAFQKTVNVITTIGKEDIKDDLPFDKNGKPRVVGKISLDSDDDDACLH